MRRISNLILIILLILFYCQPVYGNMIIYGSGNVDGTVYEMTAHMDEESTKLKMDLPCGENIYLIMIDGIMYDEEKRELKISSLFAKLAAQGLLDPLLVLEILSGKREDLYEEFMTTSSDNTVDMTIKAEDFILLYESWAPNLNESSIAENIVRQIITALDASVNYTFHYHPETKELTQIDIVSQCSAPEVRHGSARFYVAPLI